MLVVGWFQMTPPDSQKNDSSPPPIMRSANLEKFEEHYLHIYFSLTANNDLTTDTPILSPKYPSE